MIALHIWSVVGEIDALGSDGWFNRDYFYPPSNDPAKKKPQPNYGGIYRYMNNPEKTLGTMGYFGLALICNHYRVLLLALVFCITNWLLIEIVEIPHVRKIYGDALRDRSGVETVFDHAFYKIQATIRQWISSPSLEVLEKWVGIGDSVQFKVTNMPKGQAFKIILLSTTNAQEIISISECNVERNTHWALVAIPGRHMIWTPGTYCVRVIIEDSVQREDDFQIALFRNPGLLSSGGPEEFIEHLLGKFGIRCLEDAVMAGPRHLLFKRLSEAFEARFGIMWHPQEVFNQCLRGLQSLTDAVDLASSK